MAARHPILTALVLFALTGLADAEGVKIVATAPDVEVRYAAAGKWVAAEDGMELHPGDVLSTGYRSEAVLALGRSAHALVLPMTQLRVQEHGADQGKMVNKLFLRLGSMRVKVVRRAANRQQVVIATHTGQARIGPVETLVAYAEEFGMRVQALTGKSRARARHDGEVGVRDGETARVTARKAKSPREVYRDLAAPDLVIPGSDAEEVEAARQLGSMAQHPVADAASANALSDVAAIGSADSGLVFRYDVLAGQ